MLENTFKGLSRQTHDPETLDSYYYFEHRTIDRPEVILPTGRRIEN